MLWEMHLARRVTLVLLAAALLATSAAAQKKPLPPAPVNVNSATVAELKTLPGLGEVMAKDIVRYRENNGPFRRVEELLIIKGISKKRLEGWKPYLKIN